MSLRTRLDKLERGLPRSERPARAIQIVTSDEQEAEAQKLLEAEGWDTNSGEIGIIRLNGVSPGSGHPRYSEPEGVRR
jgi:hypothetical protein